MRGTLFGFAVALSLLLAEAPAMAHHSFAAEFDKDKPIKVTGIVTSMRWANPHAWIYVDVKGPDGKVVNWAFELAGLNGLYRQGWRKEDIPVGVEVTIEGFRARSNTPTGNTKSITLSNGRQLRSPVPAGEESR